VCCMHISEQVPTILKSEHAAQFTVEPHYNADFLRNLCEICAEGGMAGAAAKRKMLWVSVSLYEYMYTYIYIYLYISTYICTYIYTHTYMYVYIYIHIYICIYTYTYTYLYICICMCIYISTHMSVSFSPAYTCPFHRGHLERCCRLVFLFFQNNMYLSLAHVNVSVSHTCKFLLKPHTQISHIHSSFTHTHTCLLLSHTDMSLYLQHIFVSFDPTYTYTCISLSHIEMSLSLQHTSLSFSPTYSYTYTCIHIHVFSPTHTCLFLSHIYIYEVATISRLLKMIGLFCRI